MFSQPRIRPKYQLRASPGLQGLYRSLKVILACPSVWSVLLLPHPSVCYMSLGKPLHTTQPQWATEDPVPPSRGHWRQWHESLSKTVCTPPVSSPSSSPFLITMNSLRTILPVQKFKSLCFECSQRAQFSAVQKSTSQSVVQRALGLPDLFYRLFQGTTILMRMLSSCPLLRVQQHLQAWCAGLAQLWWPMRCVLYILVLSMSFGSFGVLQVKFQIE